MLIRKDMFMFITNNFNIMITIDMIKKKTHLVDQKVMRSKYKLITHKATESHKIYLIRNYPGDF